MHCLGAVTGGTSSPNGIGGRSGIFNVFRALGVLVCEGRIQGPPRGYKEGPHCAPPMQAVPNDHVCEEDNYLCDRYLGLIREIAEHISTGLYLCVEVLLCSDCPCGLAKSTFKYHVCPVPSLSISSWQQSSEMLLEYWFICVVPSKCPETMNFQGLYQAVRSRLHFSQLAAWWSRSNGTDPRYVVTRIVPHNEDNLRKFREAPVEHSFPLAGNGDGNSIKVTVWALPRMEEVPILYCSLHPVKEKAEEDIARALTPTKSSSVPTATQNPEALVLPALLDDRLQTTCNRSGKHHCHCEEEDTSPPSPTIRSNGERKRRRSLPCGPAENSCVNSFQSAPLPSLQESILQERKDNNSNHPRNSSDIINNRGVMRTLQIKSENRNEVQTRNNLNSDNVERCLKTQMSVEEREGIRYKFMTVVPEVANSKINIEQVEENYNSSKNSNNPGKGSNSSLDIKSTVKDRLLENLSPFSSPIPWPFVSSWQNRPVNSKFQSFRVAKEEHFNDSERDYKPLIAKDTNLAIDPYGQPNPFHEQNPGPSTHNVYCRKIDNSICSVHQSCFKNTNVTPVSTCQNALIVNKKDNIVKDERKAGKELSQLMSKLSFPINENGKKEDKGLLDWFSKKVPGKVLNVTASKSYIVNKARDGLKQSEHHNSNEMKSKNCNLELSQREFDEVLAALRTRTPTGRRRTTLRSIKRREKLLEKSGEEVEKVLTKCTCSESANVTSNKSCEGCAHRLCKKIDHQIPAEQENAQDRIYYAKNSYQVLHTKCRTDGPNKFHGVLRTDTRMNENLNRLQNVSTKADVLLDAILRTSKDQKDSLDISNGTRPRSMINIDDDSDDSNSSTEKLDQYHRLVSPYDEKFSPFVTNKRFNRLRQLCKKEEEEKRLDTTEDSSQENSPSLSQYVNPTLFFYNNEQPRTCSNIRNKVRRRIDFSNFSEVTQKKVEEQERKQDEEEEEEEEEEVVMVVMEEDTEFSTKNAHQKLQEHSTNRENDDQKYDSAYSCFNRRNHYDRLQYTKECTENAENENCNVFSAKEEIAVFKDNSTTVSSLSGHSSSKIRCNNYKDNVAEDDETLDKSVPSALEQEKFRRSLENAASMVFHSRTGLPLTSSPAPLRRGSCCFDYDSSLNSVSSKRSALFELNTPPSPGAVSLEETDRETENIGEGEETPRRRSNSRNRPQSHALLGSFEESALNGRLEPVSTVHGFSAELGASGSFCPKHQKLPVTVFFYTLGDNDKVSTPYLAHINLEKKGYQVPRSGTIQVTLLNPLGTVVKMFVVLYDLSDMPARSHTFLRQRTLRDKTLRYLVHLRFMSSKSGRIYLHTDIRMIICRKSDVDTASDFGSEPPKELRSYTHGPTNPKFSPRC